jgi:predicted RNase H-like nuclease
MAASSCGRIPAGGRRGLRGRQASNLERHNQRIAGRGRHEHQLRGQPLLSCEVILSGLLNDTMSSGATFIGLDLAWRGDANNTGAVALVGDRCHARLSSVSPPIKQIDAVLSFVDCHARGETVVAIDAPLIIANSIGQRPCETLVGSRYGSRHASCHTSNTRLYPDAGSVRLAAALAQRGFVHAVAAASSANRVMLEVYPHAALVALFDLHTILKYKRGQVAAKRQGLRELAAHIRRLASARPLLQPTSALDELLSQDLDKLKGGALKKHEDTLDALVCAYVAYYYWYWRNARTEIFGDSVGGYILNPTLLAGGVESHAAGLGL